MENNTENQQESEQPEILTSDVRNRSIKPKWLWWILGAMILMVGFFVSGYLRGWIGSGVWHKYFDVPYDTVGNPINQTNQKLTAGWKTYENKDYGFSFMYPEDYEIKTDNLLNDGLRIIISTNYNNFSSMVGSTYYLTKYQGITISTSESQSSAINEGRTSSGNPICCHTDGKVLKTLIPNNANIQMRGYQFTNKLDNSDEQAIEAYWQNSAEKRFVGYIDPGATTPDNRSSEIILFNQILSTFKFTK